MIPLALLTAIFTIICASAIGQEPEEPIAPMVAPPAKSVVKAFVYFEDTGRPVKRTSVMLMPAKRDGGGGREASGVTDNGGRVEFKGLATGKYFAIVNAPGVVSPLAYVDVRTRVGDFDNDELAALPGIFVDGLSNLEVQIPARRGGAISGRATYPDGDPAIGVSVAVLRKVGEEFLPAIPNLSSIVTMMFAGGAGSSLTDDRGAFRFAGLPAGEYLVKVTENVEHSKRSGPSFRDPFASMLFGNNSMVTVFFKDVLDKEKAELLKLEFGQELPEINITLPERELRTLSGKVVAAKDKLPIRNARVTIKREGDEGVNDENPGYPGQLLNTKITYSDGKGEWEFVELPQGKYTVTVNAENSEFDDVAKAYGYDPEDNAANTAVRAIANAANFATNANSNGYFRGSNRGPQKAPARRFAEESKEFEVTEKDLPDQVIELSHGATFSGTVTVENGAGLPTGTSIQLTDEKVESSVSTNVSGYGYHEEDGHGEKKSEDFLIDAVPEGRKFLTIHTGDNDYYVKSAFAGEIDLLQNPIEFKGIEEYGT